MGALSTPTPPQSFGFSSPLPAPTAAALATLDWSRKLDSCTIAVSMAMSVQRLLHMFKALGNHQVLVTHSGRLEAIVTRKDLMLYVKANATSRQYHNKIVLAERRRLEQQHSYQALQQQ